MSDILERRGQRRAVGVIFDGVCVHEVTACRSITNCAKLPIFTLLTVVQSDIANGFPTNSCRCKGNGSICIATFIGVSEVCGLGSKFVCCSRSRTSVTNLDPVADIFTHFRGICILQLHVVCGKTNLLMDYGKFVSLL